MVTLELGPTGEPTPPDPQAGPVRDGDGPQPAQDVAFEESQPVTPDPSTVDPAVGEDVGSDQ